MNTMNTRKYFIAPHFGAMPKGYTTHRAVYRLGSAPVEAFETFFQECLATLPPGVNVDSTEADRAHWGFSRRWWALNMVIEYGGSVAIWDSAGEALATLKAGARPRQVEVAS